MIFRSTDVSISAPNSPGLGHRFPRTFRAVVALFFLVALLQVTALAEGTAYWEWSRRSDFAAGQLSGVSLSDNGVVRASPTPVLTADLKQPFALSAVSVGGDVVVGTGHSGQVFRVSGDGKVELLADFEEMDVTALTADRTGTIFAATSPDGKIYRIGADRKPVVVADPPEKYIWALGVRANGPLVFATGAKSGLFEVDAAGGIRKLFTSSEANFTCLLVAADGAIWCGTDPGGLIVRVDPTGKVSTVYDSPVREIRRLVQGGDGAVYALGVSEKSGGVAASAAPVSTEPQPSVTVSISEEGVSEVAASPAQSSGGTTKAADGGALSAVIYKIGKDLNADTFWSATEVSVSSILVNGEGLLAGTAGQGRLLKIGPDNRFDILGQTGEEQVSFLLPGADGRVKIVTSGFSKIFSLPVGTEKAEGTLVTSVQDARNVIEDWGGISWEGKGGVTVQTRSGNTQVPDATWSDWSAETGQSGSRVASPKARFLQVRLKVTGDGEVTSLRVAYLPRNVAPTVTTLTVSAPGVALQDALIPAVDPALLATGLELTQFGVVGNQPPRKVFQKGARSLQWQAEDKNGDQLTYRVSFRLRGETGWRKLAENLRNPYLVIEGGDLPDGIYEFRVEVSDALSNAEKFAKTGSRISEPVAIDNTPPAVKFGTPQVAEGRVQVGFEVTDAGATLRKVEFAVDGGTWSPIYPVDNVLDSRTESFALAIPGLAKGDHFLSVRVMDAGFNTGSEKLTFRIP